MCKSNKQGTGGWPSREVARCVCEDQSSVSQYLHKSLVSWFIWAVPGLGEQSEADPGNSMPTQRRKTGQSRFSEKTLSENPR